MSEGLQPISVKTLMKQISEIYRQQEKKKREGERQRSKESCRHGEAYDSFTSAI
jgi:hypothetical protein